MQGLSKKAWTNVLLVGAFYFFVKFIRHSLWSWAPFFLERNFKLKGDEAGYLSTPARRLLKSRSLSSPVTTTPATPARSKIVSLIMMLVMLGSCVLLYVGGGLAVTLFAVCLGMIGFTLYGPDARGRCGRSCAAGCS